MSKKKFLKWAHMHQLSCLLAKQLQGHGIKHILAVSRGGLFPAQIVARRLDIRHIETFCCKSYVIGDRRGPLELTAPVPRIEDVSEWIVIDDICDSGQTLRAIKKTYPGIKTACLYKREEDRPECDYWVQKVSVDGPWLVFPWEM